MRVTEESCGIILDLLDLESGSSILTVLHDACRERSSETAGNATNLIIANRVGKGETRRSSLTFCCLMDMCCRSRRGLVGASDALKGNVLLEVDIVNCKVKWLFGK